MLMKIWLNCTSFTRFYVYMMMLINLYIFGNLKNVSNKNSPCVLSSTCLFLMQSSSVRGSSYKVQFWSTFIHTTFHSAFKQFFQFGHYENGRS